MGFDMLISLQVLRDMLAKNKKLRLCLMSATLDVDLFGRYFGGAPSVSIPGQRALPQSQLVSLPSHAPIISSLPLVLHPSSVAPPS